MQIAAGCKHSVALSEKGDVFVWGNGEYVCTFLIKGEIRKRQDKKSISSIIGGIYS